MPESVIIKIDIMGFNKKAQAENPEDTSEYIYEYYQRIENAISKYDWRFIKGMGDCVLISSCNDSSDHIAEFYEEISKVYNIALCYRLCRYVEKEIKIGDYSCTDVFGKDVNNLFLCDHLTTKLAK